jgi:hypothetical protein
MLFVVRHAAFEKGQDCSRRGVGLGRGLQTLLRFRVCSRVAGSKLVEVSVYCSSRGDIIEGL